MRCVGILLAMMIALPASAQTQDQMNALVSQCIFNLTDTQQIIFKTDKRDGALVINFDRRMGLSKAQKAAVQKCVAQGLG